jgi:hypothetical protein
VPGHRDLDFLPEIGRIERIGKSVNIFQAIFSQKAGLEVALPFLFISCGYHQPPDHPAIADS